MTPHSFAAPLPMSNGGGRRRRADETLGVFSDGEAWKVYSPFSTAAAYPSREAALIAAEERAFAAKRAGRKVELFVEDEDGLLAQAQLDPM